MPPITRVEDAPGSGGLWTPQAANLERWATNSLDVLLGLGETEDYFPRFPWATGDVIQPSLHAYLQRDQAAALIAFARLALGPQLAADPHIIWMRPELMHLNVARRIPRTPDEEKLLMDEEGAPARRLQVAHAFEDIPGPIDMTPDGISANGVQMMMTFDVESWSSWQPVMQTAETRLNLTSHPLNRPPDQKGALVSITFAVFTRLPDEVGTKHGMQTAPLVHALRPHCPGTQTPRNREAIRQLRCRFTGVGEYGHRHHVGDPPMSPASTLAFAEFGRSAERPTPAPPGASGPLDLGGRL